MTYKICSNCVMDTSDPEIVFDKNGICDHCTTYYSEVEPNWNTGKKGNEYLDKLKEKIKIDRKSEEFDCLIGMSGGIDSSYLTHFVTVEMGLKPLVFHVDAGWNSQIAVNNIEKLVDGLDLDLYTEVIDWEEFKDLQISFFKSGVSHIDTPQDHAFFATMYKFARKYKIKYIFTGANYSTECIRNPKDWMYYQSDSVQIKDIHNIFGKKKLKNFPLTNILWHKMYLPIIYGIKVYRPLDYTNYIKSDAKKLLIEKYGWQPYPQKHFESRFTKFYESFWLPKRFGYDVRRVQFSSLILTKQMSREDAIKELKKSPYEEKVIKEEINFIINKLDISEQEFWQFYNLPKKSYRNYKSQKSLYEFGSKVMKALGHERGGKR